LVKDAFYLGECQFALGGRRFFIEKAVVAGERTAVGDREGGGDRDAVLFAVAFECGEYLVGRRLSRPARGW